MTDCGFDQLPRDCGDAVVLAAVCSPVEQQLLTQWCAEQRAADPRRDITLLEIPTDEPGAEAVARLVSQLEGDEDRIVLPVGVFWGGQRHTSNRSRMVDLLTGRDPDRPSARRQRRILVRDESAARVVAGEPATIGELRRQWAQNSAGSGETDFARFVARRAILALERVEYRLLGPEYKSPRLVKPEMMASARFVAGLQKIPGASVEEAGKILDEMATGWSRLSVDLLPAFYRSVIRRGFDADIDYEAAQVEAMRSALQRHPAVLLFSHRSNLDAMVLGIALQANRLPQAHTFGGINMAFGVMGPIMRRSGTIFIRRSIGDDRLYKYVLKEYVGYITEKRFNLAWSIEGTRSRTGKMLPPKLGLMSYVADAYLEGRTDDILLQPVSISFDQLHEIIEYAEYARGAPKQREGLRWFYRFIKAQGERNYGKIYVRFPEAVSMARYLGEADGSHSMDEQAKRLAMQKTAFEVAWRIQRSTPINATALVSALLLATRGMALTLGQIHQNMQDVLNYLERKGTPLSDSARGLRATGGVQSALDALSNGHPVTRVDGGWEPVWRIAPEHEHEASFYRNSIIHAFLESSIVELALAHAARSIVDPVSTFWSQAMRLRDLLKFDFYFADSETFRRNLAEEMAWQPDWESQLAIPSGAIALLHGKQPLLSYAMVRTFFEAYEIAADVLRKSGSTVTEEELVKRAMGVGNQYVAQGRVRSTEPVSALLFATAAKVLADQKLLEGGPDVVGRRSDFREELRAVLDDIDDIEEATRQRFVARDMKRSEQP